LAEDMAQEVIDTLLHLPGRFIGEGNCQDMMGFDSPDLDQVGDPMGNNPGLATAGASENE